MRKLLLGVVVSCAMVASLATPVIAQPDASSAQRGQAARAKPTLGVASRYATGFGKVKPKLVGYNGDGQSFVGNIRWRSWGGRRAIGHGTASWVWPGWCSACGSVSLRATVVAFGLSSCHGRRSYRYVEWFFPGRGMRFSPRLAAANLCTWSFSSGGLFKSHRCRAIDLPGAHGSSPGLAEKIRVYQSRIGCGRVRAFLRRSGVMAHYGHNARFHGRGWWCGSELSMQLTKLPPQNFTCTHGDFASISFNVRKR